ncbi:MAG: DegV family protein [Eubacteriaceae bacterium]|nr:DegV family protein [Eubacteriaceae bacterium]
MEKILIITDSCSDLEIKENDSKPLRILPLTINFTYGSYRDRVDISPEEVYKQMEQEIPKTSIPGPQVLKNMLYQAVEEGFTHVVAITVSTGLSGTNSMFETVAKDYQNLTIAVINSLNIACGIGFLAVYAVNLVLEGFSFDEIVKKVENRVPYSKAYFSLGTLKYLREGGRIGKVSGYVGDLLKIKPIISCDEEGIYYSVAKVRGRKKSMRKIIDLVREGLAGAKRYYLTISHGSAYEEAVEIKNAMMDLVEGAENFSFGQISPVLGVHTGPGLIGVGFLKNS